MIGTNIDRGQNWQASRKKTIVIIELTVFDLCRVENFTKLKFLQLLFKNMA